MKWLTAWVVISLATLAILSATETTTMLEYEIVSIKRQLLLVTGEAERTLQVGEVVKSGATLRTGSRSRAELEVAEFAARFVVSSKTRFRLAHDQPGVLLEIERGSVRAIFGELPQGDTRERLVTTPSAVLAVRGTEYGVDVAKDGDTSITVFKGTVEVWERGGTGERIRVRAGQQTRVKKGRAPSTPQAHGLSSGDWDRGRRWSSPSMGGTQQSPGMGAGNQPGGVGSHSTQGGSKKHGG